MPTPLCAGTTEVFAQFQSRTLNFVCSGAADSLVDAIGRLAKAVHALP